MKRFVVLFLLSLALAGLSGWLWWQVTADERTAVLEVRTIPRGATVVYEGRPVEGELAGLAPGEGEVVARLKGYKEAHRKTSLKKGERTLLSIELEPQPGEVALQVTGPSKYTVRVGPDPERKFTQKDKLKLAPGRWRVEVEADGYETRSKWVEVPSGGTSEVAMTLEGTHPEPVESPKPIPTAAPQPQPQSPPSYQATTPGYTPPPYYPPPRPYTPPPPRPRPAPPEPAFTPVPVDPGPPPAPPSQPEPEFTPIP